MTFLNREVEISRFQRFLESASPEWIFAVHGVAGSGKSGLLRHLNTGLDDRYVSAWIDFHLERHRNDSRSVLQALADPLRQAGLIAGDWDEAYEDNRAKTRRPLTIQQGIDAGSRATIIDSPQIVMVYEAEERAGQYEQARHERAEAWLDLAKGLEGRLVVFLDHWDVLRRRGDGDHRAWIIEDLLLDGHKSLPCFRVVVAGERPLASDPRIAKLVRPDEIADVPLAPLRDDHALELMRQQGVEDPDLQRLMLRRCRGLPKLIELAAAACREHPGLDPDQLAESLEHEAASKWFVGELVKSMDDERSRLALEKGVILRQWVLESLAIVCGRPDLDLIWLDDFASYPFVEDSKAHLGFKEFIDLVREIEVAHLWLQETEEFQELHKVAREWYRQTKIW